MQKLIGPACVIDVSDRVRENVDFLVTTDVIEAWEAKHGRIPKGAWLLIRTDWSKRTGAEKFLNIKEDGPHTPGFHPDTLPFLTKQRDILGVGVETVGTDAGQAATFNPMFPVSHADARGESFRARELDESGSAAADRRHRDRAALEDRQRLGQSAARARPHSGIETNICRWSRSWPPDLAFSLSITSLAPCRIVQAAIAFYTDAFGASVLFQIGPLDAADMPVGADGKDWMEAHVGVKGAKLTLAMLQLAPNLKVQLIQYDKPADRKQVMPRNCDLGGHHVALLVEDIEAAAAWLKQKGCTVLEAIPMDAGKKNIYVADPWGHQFELVD